MHAECDALLFDIDGTLVDSSAVAERAWRRWAAEYGQDADAVLDASHGVRTEDVAARFLPGDRVAAAARRLTELEAEEGADASAGVVAVRGAAELLHTMDALGDGTGRARWAAVTSGERELMLERLAAVGLPTPPVLVGAADVAAGNPDPEGYRTAAARLGADPERCVVVEDSPNGIAAARAAGARVVAVAGTYPPQDLVDLPPAAAPDAVVPDLTAVHVTREPDGGLVVRLTPTAD